MGRNHKHKKNLKAEKAKTKLKQTKTKFLPKGLNVTKTTFKVKPIVIPEQLKKKDDEEVLSKRKLNVKDLLIRLKHYNENARHIACEELGSIIQTYTEEIIQKHLSLVCLAISSLMQDKERKVRKTAVKCLQIILEYIPHPKLVPFFDYFSTNLRCAMTNIDKNVQEDSLLFLDCFIQTDCGLIKKTSDKLLPDFLSLISKLRSSSEVDRTLTLNLGSKMTSVTWRIKVLSRLYAVLNMIMPEEDVSSQKGNINNPIFNEFGLYNTRLEESLDKYSMVFNNQVSLVMKGSDNFHQHVAAVLPLLHEAWLEVMPERKIKKSSTEHTDLNQETASLLSCIMNIVYLLWKYVKKMQDENINEESIFLSTESRKFLSHLLSDFPYCQLGGKGKKKKGNALPFSGSDLKCTQENLLICYLYSVIFIKSKLGNTKKAANAITAFITKYLLQTKSFKEEHISYLIKFFRECFEGHQQNWRTFGFDLRAMLENLITFYECANMSSKDKLQVFHLLATVNENTFLNQSPMYRQWLSSLPSALCEKSITDTMIFQFLQLSKKNYTGFHTALIKKLPEILANLDEINIIYDDDSNSDPEGCGRNLANIFFFLSPKEELNPIKAYVNSETSSEYKKYFADMLKLRIEFNRG